MNLTILTPEAGPMSRREAAPRPDLNGFRMSSFFLLCCPAFSPAFFPLTLLYLAVLATALSLEAGSCRDKGNNREGWAELRC